MPPYFDVPGGNHSVLPGLRQTEFLPLDAPAVVGAGGTQSDVCKQDR